MKPIGLALAVLLAAPAARAGTTCSYTTSYNEPGINGTCVVDAVAGCPVHLVLPQQPPPVEVNAVVLRNGQEVTVSESTAVVGSVSPTVTTIDYLSCTCDRTSGPMPFDEIALTLTGAQAGDEVWVGGQMITLAPHVTCGTPDWPTANDFDIQYGGCDLCPTDPVTPPNHSGGCASAPGAGWALALLALCLRTGSRRRA